VPALGASGAIAGVLGCYVRLFPLARVIVLVPIIFIPLFFEVPALVFVGIWFAIQLLQGTLDLIVLRTLATMGPQHAYQVATRLQQISDRLLNLNQGTLYPALVRLEQYGWIKGTWGRTESNREAKYYEITKAGQKALGEETQTWRRMSALVERLLLEES